MICVFVYALGAKMFLEENSRLQLRHFRENEKVGVKKSLYKQLVNPVQNNNIYQYPRPYIKKSGLAPMQHDS